MLLLLLRLISPITIIVIGLPVVIGILLYFVIKKDQGKEKNKSTAKDFATETIESALNKTLANLQMFVRDTQLPEQAAAKYTKGRIVEERGFTDASSHIGGMVTTHRYAICSNHMKTLSDFTLTDNGLCVARAGAQFFCLGQHVQNGKTLIMLLHLPDDESRQMFQQIVWINFLNDVVNCCIKQFEEIENAEPIPELADEEWLDRCSNPIGMDNEGNLFPLTINESITNNAASDVASDGSVPLSEPNNESNSTPDNTPDSTPAKKTFVTAGQLYTLLTIAIAYPLSRWIVDLLLINHLIAPHEVTREALIGLWLFLWVLFGVIVQIVQKIIGKWKPLYQCILFLLFVGIAWGLFLSPMTAEKKKEVLEGYQAANDMFKRWENEAAEQGQPLEYEDTSNMTDAEKTEHLLKRAEELSEEADARNDLTIGVSLYYGLGKDKKPDHEEAVKYLRKAAEKGIALAQLMLASCYEEGIGVQADKQEALKWYREAAEQGDERAKKCLPEIEKQVKAKIELQNRAESGDPESQYLLALNYCFGLNDFKKDSDKYHEWVKKASEHSDQNSASVQCALGDVYCDGIGVEKDRVQATEWYRKAAEQNFAPGQCFFAQCLEEEGKEYLKWLQQSAEQEFAPAQYHFGLVCRKNEEHTEAVSWFRKAAEQGHVTAQNQLGVCFGNGIGVEQDWAEALKWYRKAANQGYAEAQCNLGVLYQNTEGYENAVKWFRKAAEQGHERAKKYLQEIENKIKDNSATVTMYQVLAEQGDAAAQYNLGICYFQGKLVKKNDTEAAKWFRMAAEQGDSDAQYNLGVCYDNGFGVELDPEQAVEWFRKSAEQDHADAQFNLGVCYARGNGVERDLDAAREWYHKAAEQNCPEALYNLANFYLYNIGGKKDEQEGIKLMQKAADLGELRAQHTIGYWYENGDKSGYEKNRDEAKKWYDKSAAQGYAGAKESLRRIEEN
ncbi:MAG: sel1 repeat family protein [Planctomycetaceae bacterium]|jgi:TPR repeat protein|nr:sel1 repeat family protein [Planctomycetaceae bacterium]